MTTERIVLIVVGAINAAAAAVLAYPTNDLPIYVRVAIGAASAACGFALTQMNGWDKAGESTPPPH